MNSVAQVDLNDPNWGRVFFDDFTTNHWNTWDNWIITHPTPFGHYISYYLNSSFGVTHGQHEHQIYQRENCIFGNGKLILKSYYAGGSDQIPFNCGDYALPPDKICDSAHHSLYFTSGMIHTLSKFKYGYFEITCSLPIHKGSFPAFWLYNQGNDFYNEIDIFEYSWGISYVDHFKQFTCGLYCDNDHQAPDTLTMISHGKTYPVLPNASNDLSHSHVFACEWLPYQVTWYVDGAIVNKYDVSDSIPNHPLYLITNYAINNQIYSDSSTLVWSGNDEMIVDSIRVFRLKTDCDSDVIIRDLQDLSLFQPSVKKTICIEPSGEMTIPANSNIFMRAVDSIVINKGFTIPLGAQLVLRTQPCPE